MSELLGSGVSWQVEDGGSLPAGGTSRARDLVSNETVMVSNDCLAKSLSIQDAHPAVGAPGMAPVDRIALLVGQVHVNCLLLEKFFFACFPVLLIKTALLGSDTKMQSCKG